MLTLWTFSCLTDHLANTMKTTLTQWTFSESWKCLAKSVNAQLILPTLHLYGPVYWRSIKCTHRPGSIGHNSLNQSRSHSGAIKTNNLIDCLTRHQKVFKPLLWYVCDSIKKISNPFRNPYGVLHAWMGTFIIAKMGAEMMQYINLFKINEYGRHLTKIQK